MGKYLPWCDYKKPKRNFGLFLRDWYRLGFKLFSGEEADLRFNCLNNIRVFKTSL